MGEKPKGLGLACTIFATHLYSALENDGYKLPTNGSFGPETSKFIRQHMADYLNTHPAPSEAEVEAAAKRMVKLCSPPKGASFEQACEWVPPTIEDLARAALGVE